MREDRDVGHAELLHADSALQPSSAWKPTDCHSNALLDHCWLTMRLAVGEQTVELAGAEKALLGAY